jgi:hypothetical protein
MHMAVTAGGPRLGELEAGLVASITSVGFSVISGGIACILGAVAIARWSPRLAEYVYNPDDPLPSHPESEPRRRND